MKKTLEDASITEPIPVIVWFIDNSRDQVISQLETQVGFSVDKWKNDIVPKSSIDQIHSFKLLKATTASRFYSYNNQEYVDQYLNDSTIIYISKLSPMVLAKVEKSTVQKLVISNKVEYIDLYCDEITSCSIETEASKIDLASIYYPCTGTGVRIGILDTEVPNSNQIPNCNIVSTYGSNVSGSTTSHAESMSAIIMSIAPDADYFLAGGPGLNIFDAVEWLIDNGIDIINMSLGFGFNTSSYSIYSKWFDHIAYEHYVTFVTSIGNKRLDENNEYTIVDPVSEFKMAYNLLAVGGINTNMTPLNYYDDFQAATTFSQSTNNVPFKPDICAPYGDSSSSSALVAGVVALLMDEENAFSASPDSIKAVVTACVNQTSPYQFLPKNRNTNPTVNSYMQFGAGLIDAFNSLDCTCLQNFKIDVLTSNVSSKSYVIPVDDSGEQKVSLSYIQPVGISSTSHTNGYSFSSSSLVDLDLFVFDENGNLIDYSVTTENNVEIVHFAVSSAGTYTITVERYGSQTAGTIIWFTIAWCEVGT